MKRRQFLKDIFVRTPIAVSVTSVSTDLFADSGQCYGSGGNDLYINPSSSLNGSGSIGSPLNSFQDATLKNWQGGGSLYIKAGTVTRETLSLPNADRFRITSYGKGPDPIIKAMDVFINWIDAGDGTWFKQLGTGVEESLFAGGLKLLRVNTRTELVRNNSWYDKADDRHYVILDTADPSLDTADPNNVTMEATTRNACVKLNKTYLSDSLIENIHCIGSRDTSFEMVRIGNNITIRNVLVEYGGAESGYGRDNFLLRGQSGSSKATNLAVINCRSVWARNNAWELSYLDGALFKDCFGSAQVGNMFELWQGVTNSVFEGNQLQNPELEEPTKFLGSGASRFIWLSGPKTSQAQNHGNTFRNNIAGNTRSSAIVIDSYNHYNKIYNNTFHAWAATGGVKVSDKGDTENAPTGTEIKNNIFYSISNNTFISAYTVSDIHIDANLYFRSLTGEKTWSVNSKTARDIAAWNSFEQVGATAEDMEASSDPFVDYANNAFTPASVAGVNAVDNGIDGLVITDFNDTHRHVTDIGALEKV